MRQASFLVKGENGATADVSFVKLGPAAGNLLDNVNRWLGQLGQPPVTPEKLTGMIQKPPTARGEVDVVDLSGKPEDGDASKGAIANFASQVALIDPERSLNRDVLIYMNHPLRYRGETYYQAGFQKDDSATILQVVHNPSFLAPYVACVIVAAGLLVQFGYHLVGFARRRRALA